MKPLRCALISAGSGFAIWLFLTALRTLSGRSFFMMEELDQDIFLLVYRTVPWLLMIGGPVVCGVRHILQNSSEKSRKILKTSLPALVLGTIGIFAIWSLHEYGSRLECVVRCSAGASVSSCVDFCKHSETSSRPKWMEALPASGRKVMRLDQLPPDDKPAKKIMRLDQLPPETVSKTSSPEPGGLEKKPSRLDQIPSGDNDALH